MIWPFAYKKSLQDLRNETCPTPNVLVQAVFDIEEMGARSAQRSNRSLGFADQYKIRTRRGVNAFGRLSANKRFQGDSKKNSEYSSSY